ncbi:unnamed protein product, partial [Brenthis ino]
MCDKINPEFLICLVESRPALWDKSLENYKDFGIRAAAWRDICRIMNPEFNTITRTQQNAYVKFIMKKWINIRDAWKKSLADIKRKSYKHNARLKFLEKNFTNRIKLSLNNTEPEDDSDTNSDSSTNGDNTKEENEKKKNEESTQEENEINAVQFMDIKSIEETSPHISFVKGLLPFLNKLGEDEVLEFQMGVIQLLWNIRKKGRTVDQLSVEGNDMPSSSFTLSHLKQHEP